MASGVDNESEILLGNKQLLAVFAVVALLLAIAFTGGYVLGKSSAEKKAVTADSSAGDSGTALVPRTVAPDDSASTKPDTSAPKPDALTPETKPVQPETKAPAAPAAKHALAESKEAPPLGTKLLEGKSSEGTPHPGQTFVQVAALTHTEAAATAEVLRKQNLQARIAPKPGSTTIFRVLVGPTKDASEITATRDALRKIGFRDVIVQRY